MTDIPKARSILEEVLCWDIDDHVAERLKEALELMTRKVSPKRPTGNVPMTAELGAKVRELYGSTNYSNDYIGRILHIDGGRVSEAINGRWQ